jgi:mycoredoxin
MPSKHPRLRPFLAPLAPALAVFLLAALGSSTAGAAGAAGSDTPKGPSHKAAPPHQPAPHQPAAAAPADAQKAKVILYSTAWCGYCRKTRELLTSLQVPFVEKDIEKSPEARAEYQAKGKGYRGVPLTDVAGTLVKGYLPDEVKKLVSELQKKEAAEKTAR